MTLPEREFFCGQPARVYINKKDSIAPLQREGIFEGWSVYDSDIWLVLRQPNEAYKLIPLGILTKHSVAKLGGVAKHAIYELGNSKRTKEMQIIRAK